MNQDKIHLINILFNNKGIRTIWDKEQEKYFINKYKKIKKGEINANKYDRKS